MDLEEGLAQEELARVVDGVVEERHGRTRLVTGLRWRRR